MQVSFNWQFYWATETVSYIAAPVAQLGFLEAEHYRCEVHKFLCKKYLTLANVDVRGRRICMWS